MKSILLKFAQDMLPDAGHVYYYKYSQQMNYIKRPDGMELPFVDSGLDRLCISTKTEQVKESDDSVNEMLLITTKTFTQQEADDQGFTYYE